MRKNNRIAIIVGLTLCMLFSVIGLSMAAQPSDIQGNWAEPQISDWLKKGLAQGYQDGTFKPDNSITRAEFITLTNHAFAFTSVQSPHFSDVSTNDWFAGEIAKAQAAAYISGYQDGTVRPNEEISRQEVASIIARIAKLELSQDNTALNRFNDTEEIPGWSKGAISAVVTKGFMQGYPDQTYQPLREITRAEAIVTLNNVIKENPGQVKPTTEYNKAGIYGSANDVQTTDGNVTVSVAGVTLQNMIIIGHLTLAEGIGDGDVTLKNVIVQENCVIKGGGSHSVILENCTLPSITISKEGVRVVAAGNTTVSIVVLESGAILVETENSYGFETVTLSDLITAGTKVILTGNFTNVNVEAAKVSLAVTSGTVAKMEVAAKATGATIDFASGVKVDTLTLNSVVSVTGQGTINTSKESVSGTTYEHNPTNVVSPTASTNQTTPTAGTGSGTGTGSGNGNAPLNLVDSNPTNGSTDIGVHPTIKLTFDRGVVRDYWDNNKDCFSLRNNSMESVSIMVSRAANYLDDSEKRSIYITPNSNLAAGVTYTLTVSANLKANNSNTLGSEASISFTVAGSSGGGGGGGGGDSIPPTFDTTYPKISNMGQDWVNLLVKTNENGKVYYVVLLDGDQMPTVGQVKAGMSAKNSATLLKGSRNLTANTEVTLNIPGLTAGSAYDVYFAVEDIVPNLQALPMKVDVTTSIDDHSCASAALTESDDKVAATTFGLSISGVKDATGLDLVGYIAVVVTSDKDGVVFDGNVLFVSGAATAVIPSSKVKTAGANTLTVIITGITPQPTVAATVVAASEISSAYSTVGINASLSEGTSSTITVTLRDAYNNPIANTTKDLNLAVIVTNNNATSIEAYTIDGSAPINTTTVLVRPDISTDDNGQWEFDVVLPAIIDIGDGVSLQICQSDNSIIGSAFAYIVSDQSGASVTAPLNTTRRESIPISITEAKNTSGILLNGIVTLNIISDIDGSVFNNNVNFINGATTILVPTTDTTTSLGTHTYTVALSGVTSQSTVQVTIADSSMDPGKCTVEIDQALNIGLTSTVTVTLKDASGNPLANTSKNLKIAVTVTNSNANTRESYVVGGTLIESTPPQPLAKTALLDENGQYTFTVIIPNIVDPSDGVNLQVTKNNGEYIGGVFTYLAS